MNEGHQVTVHVGLAAQLNELARAVRDLRVTLAEKEDQLEEKTRTNEIHLQLIVALQREVAGLKGEKTAEAHQP